MQSELKRDRFLEAEHQHRYEVLNELSEIVEYLTDKDLADLRATVERRKAEAAAQLEMF